MSFQEKHQYFFEKYLRNEMPPEERAEFDEKLSSDADFGKQFLHYTQHREEILKEVSGEQTDTKPGFSIHSFIYLIISIAGIILIINYYMYRLPVSSQSPSSYNTLRTFFLDRFRFFGKEPSTIKQNKVEPLSNGEKKSDSDHVVAELLMATDEIPEIIGDRFLADTFITIHLVSDTITADTMHSELQTLFVEFWESPVHYRGYQFSGKKLILYGVDDAHSISVYFMNDHYILRIRKENYFLQSDHTFHKF
jgi:hypothetical protein